MRKKLLLLMLLLLVLVPTIGITQAQSAEDITSLAVHFPEDTLIFAALRTDDAMFDELDALLNQFRNNIPGLLPSGIGSRDLLDLFLIEQTGLSSQILLDWMGDSVAIGLPSLDWMMTGDTDAIELTIAAAVSDRAAAEDFIRLAATGEDVSEITGEAYTLFTDDSGMSVLISDTVLLLGLNTDVKALVNLSSASLRDNASFQSTLAELPADDYVAVAYADAQSLTEISLQFSEMSLAELPADQQELLSQLLEVSRSQTAAVGQIGLGLTLIDTRNVVMDMVVTIPEDSPYAAATMMTQDPVNLDFAAHIPGGAELVIQGSNVGGNVIASLASLDAVTPAYQELLQAFLSSEDALSVIGDLLREMDLDTVVSAEDALAFLQGVDIGTVKLGGVAENLLTQLLAGATGLNLRNDVLEVLDGDSALWIDLMPLEGAALPITLDAAFVSGSSDSAATAHIVEQIARAAELYGLPHGVEAVGSGNAVALGEVIQALLAESGEVPPEIANMSEFDILIGSNDDLFVMGTRPGAGFALGGDAAGSLQNSSAYQYAAENLFLDDTLMLMFVNIPGFVDVLPALEPFMNASDMSQFSMIGAVAESMTITSTASDTTQTVRLTFTIPAEPYMPPAPAKSSTSMDSTNAITNVGTGSPYDGLEQNVATGIAQLGVDNNAVLVAMYESFSCPHCANFHASYMTDLIALAQTGNVTLQYIPMLTGNVPGGDVATAAAYCAGEQGRFWDFHDRLFEWHLEYGETAFDTGRMEAGLVELGVDLDLFFSCFGEGRGFTFLDQGIQLARENGVNATPTVFVNGVQVSPADMIAAINDALP